MKNRNQSLSKHSNHHHAGSRLHRRNEDRGGGFKELNDPVRKKKNLERRGALERKGKSHKDNRSLTGTRGGQKAAPRNNPNLKKEKDKKKTCRKKKSFKEIPGDLNTREEGTTGKTTKKVTGGQKGEGTMGSCKRVRFRPERYNYTTEGEHEAG